MKSWELDRYRHRKEMPRYYLTLFVIGPFLVLLVAIFVTAGMQAIGPALVLISIIVFIRWFVIRMTMALVHNNMVRVTPKSFPEAYAAIKEAQKFFNYHGAIVAFVYEEGTYNAAILPLLRTKIIFLNSEIMDPDEGQNPEMRFIIGRFIGALAARHYRFMWLEVIVDAFEKIAIFNVLLYPYQRATQLTGDRLGFAFIDGDIKTALRVMMRFAGGRDVGHRASVMSFIAQGRYDDGLFSFLTRMLSKFPHLTYRVNSLLMFARR